MKKYVILTHAVFLYALMSQAQAVFEPAIIVLYPYEIIASDTIDREHDVYVKELDITDELRKNYVKPGLAPNWKIIREKELEFIKKQDFATLLTLSLSRELTYKELEHHENLLIFPVKEPVNNKILYKSIAQKNNVTWVVNILKVELSTVKQVKKMKLSLQLYNVVANRIMLETSYTADDIVTPDSCEAGGWLCLVENIKAPVIAALEERIEKNSHLYK